MSIATFRYHFSGSSRVAFDSVYFYEADFIGAINIDTGATHVYRPPIEAAESNLGDCPLKPSHCPPVDLQACDLEAYLYNKWPPSC